jgi:hypothetical protein
MMFIATWQIRTGGRARALSRFAAGRAHATRGLQVLQRWHRADGNGGGMLFEADNAEIIAEANADWSDLVDVQVMPVLRDRDLMYLVGARQRQP